MKRDREVMESPFTDCINFSYVRKMLTAYCTASKTLLTPRRTLKDWNAQIFSSRTSTLIRVPAEANPIIVASWMALHTRSNIESRENRTSNSVTCSQVDQITPRKQTYDPKAVRIRQSASIATSKWFSVGIHSYLRGRLFHAKR